MSHIPINIVKFYAKLKEFREMEKYVDISIVCENRTFQCHRIALSMASVYFDTMFASSFKESSAPEVVLREINARTFEQVLNFIYTGDAVVNSSNVSDLLRASDFFGIRGIEDLCVKFARNKEAMTVRNSLDIFEFACATGNGELNELMSNYIARHYFYSFSKTNLFLETSFKDLHRILRQYYLFVYPVNEEMLLSAIIRWVHHKHVERSQHFNEFFRIIRMENISPLYLRLLADNSLLSTSLPTSTKQQQVLQSIDYDEISESRAVLEPETFLHIYIEYEDENLAKIFSINDNGNYSISGEIPIDSTNGKPYSFRNISLDNSNLLYCLSFYDDLQLSDPHDILCVDDQTFSAFTSSNQCCKSVLTPPPVTFGHPHLCHVQNNIYAYNTEFHKNYLRTNNSEMFTDEELGRGIYVYNCDVNKWFPVPPLKEPLTKACMTASDNIVYLIGGRSVKGISESSRQTKGFAQAYDFRTGKWQKLPSTSTAGVRYTNAACCALDGKIYLFGGSRPYAERYDPVRGKWENILTVDHHECNLITPYSGRIWLMGRYYADGADGDDDLGIYIYNPSSLEWDTSPILVEAAIESHEILDCIVFK